MEDGKLVHKQLKEDPCEYIREITGDEMKIVSFPLISRAVTPRQPFLIGSSFFLDMHA